MKYFLTGCLALMILTFFSGCKSSQKVTMPADVSIVTRQQWGAASPVLSMRSHVPKQITIHHTAVKQSTKRTLAGKLKALQKFSMERSPLSDGRIKEPWADIPYHFYIDLHGSIGEGRELKYVSDSNTPYDPSGHALIVLEGNFNDETVTEKQYASLEKLVIAVARQYNITADKISGHKDHAETGCPGTQLYALIPKLKLSVENAGRAR